jgi:hypothetical protein
MQKVEGSSPFIRFNKAPLKRGFLFPEWRQNRRELARVSTWVSTRRQQRTARRSGQ